MQIRTPSSVSSPVGISPSMTGAAADVRVASDLLPAAFAMLPDCGVPKRKDLAGERRLAGPFDGLPADHHGNVPILFDVFDLPVV